MLVHLIYAARMLALFRCTQRSHVELKGDAEDGVYSEDAVDKKIIWRYCFHTGFAQSQPYRLHASDLDVLPADLLPTGASVPNDLIVDMVVGPSTDGGAVEETVSLFPKCDSCLEDISALHAVDADPKKVETLENRDVDAKVAAFALQRTNNNLEEAYNIHSLFRLDDDDCDDQSNTGKTNPEPRPANPEPRTSNPEPRVPNPEPRKPNPEARAPRRECLSGAGEGRQGDPRCCAEAYRGR